MKQDSSDYAYSEVEDLPKKEGFSEEHESSEEQKFREREPPEEQEVPEGQELLTPAEAASYLRLSKSSLDKLRVYGGGPLFLRPVRRRILYRKTDLDHWLDRQSFESTKEYNVNGSNDDNSIQRRIPKLKKYRGLGK